MQPLPELRLYHTPSYGVDYANPDQALQTKVQHLEAALFEVRQKLSQVEGGQAKSLQEQRQIEAVQLKLWQEQKAQAEAIQELRSRPVQQAHIVFDPVTGHAVSVTADDATALQIGMDQAAYVSDKVRREQEARQALERQVGIPNALVWGTGALATAILSVILVSVIGQAVKLGSQPTIQPASYQYQQSF